MKKYLFPLIGGAILTLFGFLAGLQISTTLGNILVFPFVIVSKISGEGIGDFSGYILAGLFILTSVIWALLISLLFKWLKRMV